jgi:hypothetical protein
VYGEDANKLPAKLANLSLIKDSISEFKAIASFADEYKA